VFSPKRGLDCDSLGRVSSSAARYRGLSFWHETVDDDLTPRPPLIGDATVDVAIIGGGLTGLWTAYYLNRAEPGLRIAILEKEIAGFGASGRNGGWCSALFPKSTASLARSHGREAALAMRSAMIATVDEVGRVTAAEGIDCDYLLGGTIAFARSRVQRAAAEAEVGEAKSFGVDNLEFLDTSSVHGAARAIGAAFDPACARIHPAKLVRGLARLIEQRGVAIFEQTTVLHYSPNSVRTETGEIRAEFVVSALEGYGATLAQTHRKVLPLYSLMIATEPLDDETWEQIGIRHGQTFTDYRHLLIYGQRTADNRFAFGGRGARYHWGSAIKEEYDRVPRVFDRLRSAIVDLFPAAKDIVVSHSWGGPIGVPRDWHASVDFDRSTGIGSAGGYVGDGLSTTNLAGRTLADLITGTNSSLTQLPWVNHRSRSWELEPLRFVGANAGMLAMQFADVEERVTHLPSIAAKIMGPLVGH
jgi:glycine/D-amino acid oxidase-like deaminating enzyme